MQATQRESNTTLKLMKGSRHVHNPSLKEEISPLNPTSYFNTTDPVTTLKNSLKQASIPSIIRDQANTMGTVRSGKIYWMNHFKVLREGGNDNDNGREDMIMHLMIARPCILEHKLLYKTS